MATTLIWPEGVLPSSFNWYLKSNGTSFISPWNGQTQTMRYPGSAWKATMTLRNLDDFESRAVEAIIAELDGLSGRIRLRDFGRHPLPAKGAPTVNGAGQTGSNLSTKGWAANTKVLLRGDYITVNDELKLVLADVTSNTTGVALVRIAPMLRNQPANGAPIEVTNPYGIFRLNKDENGMDREPGIVNGTTLEFIEVF